MDEGTKTGAFEHTLSRFPRLSDADQRALSDWLAEFEASWSPQRLARSAAELPGRDTVLRRPALYGTLLVDLRRRWESGRPIPVEKYFQQFPDLAAESREVIGLLKAEYDLRKDLGHSVTVQQYADRFPDLADKIRRWGSPPKETDGDIDLEASHDTVVPQSDPRSTPTPQHDLTTAGKPVPPVPPPAASAAGGTLGGAELTRAPDSPHPSLPHGLVMGDIRGDFGRYKIIRRLGRGGMGTVFLAMDTQLDRQVALKVPNFSEDDGGSVAAPARFRQEARAAAGLSHPNICAVFDVGQADGVHYITMAYVEGNPLSQRLKGNKFLPIGETVMLVRKIALALAYAHQTGVVHRDLKPANIMIDSRGEPIVMDFGLARRSDEQGSRLTATGEVIGTIAYMPPEQLSGDLERIGPHSDVYSLGVILYETLTGQLPFDGPPAQMITKLLREDAKLMGDIQPHLQGSPLEKVVRKAMAKKVADRYPNMGEFEAALGHAIGDPKKVAAVTLSNEPRRTITMVGQPLDEAVTTPKPGGPRRWQSDAKSARRKKSKAPALLFLLALLAIAGGLLAWQFGLHRHLPDFGSLFAKTEIPKVELPKVDDPKFIIPPVPVDPPQIENPNKSPKTAVNTTPSFEKPAIESPIEPMPNPTIPMPVTPDPPVLPKPKPPETPVKPAKGDLERWQKFMDDARAKVEKRDLPGALGDLTVALGHAPDDARTARSLLERARVSLAFTAYGAARTDADQVGPLDPALGDEAALISAEANRQLWDFPASLEACDRIRSDSHRSVAIAHANRALVFVLMEDWKEAANEIGFAFDSWAECPTALLAAASIAFVHEHDPEIAIALVDRGLALAPNDPALLVLRAQVRTRLRLFDDAIRDCDEAAKRCLWLDPHIARIQAKLARDRFGYTTGKKSALETDISAVRKLGLPDTPAEWIHTATLFRLRGDLDGALACCLKALAQQPTAVPGLLARAGIQVDRRDFPSVADDCRKVLDASPDNARALYLLGLASFRDGDLDGALKTYVRSELSEPHFVLPIIGRSDVHGRRKEFPKVIELCDYGLKIEPDQPSLYFNRAYAKNEIGDFAGAIRDYDKAIEFDNNNARSFNNRGLVWARLKNFAKAADDFTESILRNPKNEKTYKNRAAAYQQLGRFDEAAEDRRMADTLVGKIDAPKSKGP